MCAAVMNNPATRCAFLVALALLPVSNTLAAEDAAAIVLSAEPPEPGQTNYTNAEILPVPDNDTVFSIRETDTSELLYRFNLEGVNLFNLLGTLSQTLYDKTDTAAMIRHGERLTIWDDSVRMRYIDVAVDKLNLTETLDIISLAANCNIFVTNRTIVVDRCD